MNPHIPRRQKIEYTLNESKEWNAYAPLHYAAMNGELASTKVLLKADDLDINTVSNLRRTPLHLAAQKEHADVLSELIEAGANMNSLDHQKCTPLMLAAKYGSLKALEALLIRNAKYSLVDYRKWTALHYASFYNQPKIVKKLVRWDFDRQYLVKARNS